MSKLLINEQPLQVLPSLAEAIGLNQAIALQQVHYWLENARKPMMCVTVLASHPSESMPTETTF